MQVGLLKTQGDKSERTFMKEGSTQANPEHVPLRGQCCPLI